MHISKAIKRSSWNTQSLLVAISLLGIYLSNEMHLMYGITFGNTIIYMFVSLLTFYRMIVNWNKIIREFDCIFPILFSFTMLMLTVIRPDYSTITASQVVVFVLMPQFYFINQLDGYSLLKTILLMSVLLVPSAISLTSLHDLTWQMPLSYALATPVTASILMFRYYYDRMSNVDRLLAVLTAIYFAIMVMYGRRGPVLVIFVAILIILIKPATMSRNITLRQTIVVFIAIVSTTLIVVNIEETLLFTSNLLNRMGLETTSLTRTLELATSRYGADAGRSELLPEAVSLFLKSPIYGNGIGSFFYVNSGGHVMTYPHNLILQLLTDGGIVLAMLVIIPIIMALFRMLISNSTDYYVTYFLLFVLAIPHLLVSSDIFLQPELWILLALSHRINVGFDVSNSVKKY